MHWTIEYYYFLSANPTIAQGVGVLCEAKVPLRGHEVPVTARGVAAGRGLPCADPPRHPCGLGSARAAAPRHRCVPSSGWASASRSSAHRCGTSSTAARSWVSPCGSPQPPPRPCPPVPCRDRDRGGSGIGAGLAGGCAGTGTGSGLDAGLCRLGCSRRPHAHGGEPSCFGSCTVE